MTENMTTVVYAASFAEPPPAPVPYTITTATLDLPTLLGIVELRAAITALSDRLTRLEAALTKPGGPLHRKTVRAPKRGKR